MTACTCVIVYKEWRKYTCDQRRVRKRKREREDHFSFLVSCILFSFLFFAGGPKGRKRRGKTSKESERMRIPNNFSLSPFFFSESESHYYSKLRLLKVHLTWRVLCVVSLLDYSPSHPEAMANVTFLGLFLFFWSWVSPCFFFATLTPEKHKWRGESSQKERERKK